MAANPFGPGFEQELNKEIGKAFLHTNEGREIERRYEKQGGRQTEPEFRLRGKPGSQERYEQMMEHVQDPTLVSEMAYESIGTYLRNALHTIRAYENSDYYDGDNYPQEVIDQFTGAARMLGAVGDPQLYAAFQGELGDSPFLDYLSPAVEYARQEGVLESYDLERAQAQKQLDKRHEVLQNEYSDISKRTGPHGLEAAHQFLTGLGDTLYDPNMPEDQMRAAARATAEAAAATHRGIDQMEFLSAFDAEVARSHGPGSSWSDEQREKWEGELRAGTVETVERKFGDPSDHDARAIEGLLLDDHKRATGKGIFQHQVEHALDEHDSHARQNMPHANAMADALVEDFERTHDTAGRDSRSAWEKRES
jgi:hypothetical protein